MSVTVETPKVAMSSVPLGTVRGDQFVAVFQSLLIGLVRQVALPAKTALSAPSKTVKRIAQNRRAFLTAASCLCRLLKVKRIRSDDCPTMTVSCGHTTGYPQLFGVQACLVRLVL